MKNKNYQLKTFSVDRHDIALDSSLSTNTPIALGSLSEEEFDEVMDKAAMSYKNGLCVDIADFKKELNK